MWQKCHAAEVASWRVLSRAFGLPILRLMGECGGWGIRAASSYINGISGCIWTAID
jgi:hypothetical protein